MPVEAAKGGWETATQYGVLGVVCFFAISGLIWFVISQKKDLKESNTKVISLLEGCVKESTAAIKESTGAKHDLARAIRGLQCYSQANQRHGSAGQNILDTPSVREV